MNSWSLRVRKSRLSNGDDGKYPFGTAKWAYALKRGKQINAGAYKDCYNVVGHEDLVILKCRNHLDSNIGEQAFIFAELREMGIDIPEFYYCEDDFAVVKKYPYHDRMDSYDRKSLENKLVSKKTIETATRLIEGLMKTSSYIRDFQYFLDHDGSLIVSDPMEIIQNSNPDYIRNEIKYIVKLAYQKSGKNPEGMWAW